MRALLERTESLASSASALKLSCDLCLLLFVLVLVGRHLARAAGTPGSILDWNSMGIALVVAVPAILLAGDVIASVFAATGATECWPACCPLST